MWVIRCNSSDNPLTVTYPAIENRFAMGWIHPTTTFYYGQRSKCADLPELLQLGYFSHPRQSSGNYAPKC